MSAISDLLAQAKLPEHVEKVCLRGDLVAEHERLERELADVQRRPAPEDDRIGTPVDSRERDLAVAIVAVEAEMEAATVPFRFQAITRPEKNRMVLAFPPREGNAADKAFGANQELFFAAMLRASLIDPKPESDAEFDQLVAVLSDGQFDTLVAAALRLTGGVQEAPFSRAASAVLRRSPVISE